MHKIFFYCFVLFVASGFFTSGIALDSNQRKDQMGWVYSLGFLNVYFDDGTLKQGFGTLLKNGFFLTSSDLMSSGGALPKRIYVRMQDDSANSLMCVAYLEVRALDLDRGLALLQTLGFTDQNCNSRNESFYHKRIYDLYFVDLFAHSIPMDILHDSSDRNAKRKLYFPYFGKNYNFSIATMDTQGSVFFYDFNLKRYIFFGLKSSGNFDFLMGSPFFDESGDLVGIYTDAKQSEGVVIVHRNVIKSFLCNIESDFKLYLWNVEDCRAFQRNIIDNIKDIVQDREDR